MWSRNFTKVYERRHDGYNGVGLHYNEDSSGGVEVV